MRLADLLGRRRRVMIRSLSGISCIFRYKPGYINWMNNRVFPFTGPGKVAMALSLFGTSYNLSMIQIGEVIVSLDIFEKKFSCDLTVCKGVCCIEGDYGAPLEDKEMLKIEENYPHIKPYMTEEGIMSVEAQGFAVKDCEGEWVTPLVNNRECAYAIQENGCCWCAIEKSWSEKKSVFRKPVSCHLYPIRVARYPAFEALNYHKWKICSCARVKGYQEGIPLYRFLKEALIERYGEEWYSQLEYAAKELEEGRLIIK